MFFFILEGGDDTLDGGLAKTPVDGFSKFARYEHRFVVW